MTTIVFFREEDGSTPFRDWFHELPLKAKIQCRARLQLLAEQGHLLRRPAADYLRDGVYELRAKAGRVHYRMLYFFHGQAAVVISHGIVKHQAAVPPTEIDRAVRRRVAYARSPIRYTDVTKERP
jgi:phage-related protein